MQEVAGGACGGAGGRRTRTGAQTGASAASRAVAPDSGVGSGSAGGARSALRLRRIPPGRRDTGGERVAAVARRGRPASSRGLERRAGIVAARTRTRTRVRTAVRPGADRRTARPAGGRDGRPRSALRHAGERPPAEPRVGPASAVALTAATAASPPMAAPTDWVSGIRASSGACVSQESGPSTSRILRERDVDEGTHVARVELSARAAHDLRPSVGRARRLLVGPCET